MAVAFDTAEEMADAALLALYAEGDMAAARTLTLRHAPRVLAQARRLLRDEAEAEDVAQEAMLRLWRLAPNWRDEGAKVSTWLYRVVANLCTDRLRRRRSVGLDAAPEPEDEAPGPVERLRAAERAEAVQAAIARLPERQRTAIALRHFEGFGNADIAECLETSVEAVESLLARGRRALAAELLDQRPALGLGDV
ncbi:MAG: RNA polymerase sigma factor [Pseudomonadota bacterium]